MRGFDADDLERDALSIEDNGSMEGDPSAVSHKALERGRTQLGSLGGGNHFIELQSVARIDDPGTARAWGLHEGQLVVMIHSGSRGFGHEVAGQYMRAAAQYCEWQGLAMPNRQLAYIPLDSKLGRKYIGAMRAAANFAFLNRQAMAQLVRKNVRHMLGQEVVLPLVYDVPHNIAKFEEADSVTYCVHRKGATRAFSPAKMKGTPFAETGQPVLIPGSMGTASYLLAGVDSGAESLFTVNHGAGRVMSRTEAAGKKRNGRVVREGAITQKRFAESMGGVHLICDDKWAIREEAPDAYKDIDTVIDTVAGAGLAKVVARMVPLAVLKG
jgi:tRNA-splicing ligase RtcB